MHSRQTTNAKKIEMAMRSLHTKVLGSGSTADPKKKVYPVNYVEDEVEEAHNVIEDEAMDEEWILQSLAEQGDEDAQVIAEFEDQLVEVVQDSPELSLCFSAYSEARSRTRDRIKARGFWPPKGKGKGTKKGFNFKGGGKRRQSLADRIAASHCRVCGQKGHWKWECPKKSNTSTTASTADVNVALKVESGNFEEEIVDLPPVNEAVISLHDLLHGRQDCTSGFQSAKPPFEFLGNQKVISHVNEEFMFMKDSGRNFGTIRKVAQSLDISLLNQRLSKVVERVSSRTKGVGSETVLSAEVGCPGIIDTGASKSVIGQRRVKRLIESLPKAVQERVQWGKSETVFRFGNNGVLSSVGALYLPIGDRWMRLEVVNGGETPFLLSNAFLKSIAADVSSGNGELIFQELGCKVLKTYPKGLFTVELSEVLQVFSKFNQKDWNAKSCEVVTFASDHIGCKPKQNHHTSTAAAITARSVENSAAQLAHTRDLRSVSHCSLKRVHGEHEGQPIDEWQSGNGGTPSVPRGCRAELCKSKPSSHSSTSGYPDDGKVGRSALSRREASEQKFPGGVQPRPQVPGLHDESSKSHKCVGFEFPELCPGNDDEHQPVADQTGFQSDGDSNVGRFVQGYDTTLEARGRQSGVGAHDRSPRAFSTTQEEPQPRDLGERRHEVGQGCREGTGHHDQDCRFAAGARSDEKTNRKVEVSCSVTPATVPVETDETMSTPKDVGDCHRELERLSVLIQKELDAMLALSWEATAQRDKSPSKNFQTNNQNCKLDLLEIYCEEGSNLTEMALQMGLRAKRFTKQDGDLSTAQGQAKLGTCFYKNVPVTFGCLRNVQPAEHVSQPGSS